MRRLQKRLNSSSIKEVGNRGSIHGLDYIDCYFPCMSYCLSACNPACDPKCNIGYDAFEAYFDQSNAKGQTGFSARYWENPC